LVVEVADVSLSFELSVEVDPPRDGAHRAHRARALLRRILTDSQWREFERYRSVRFMVNDEEGLPLFWVEVGVRVKGLIQFNEMGKPCVMLNAYPNTPNDDEEDWIEEDLVIAMILRLRQGARKFIAGCCHGNLDEDDLRAVSERTFHL
jgi:hypothetical protein